VVVVQAQADLLEVVAAFGASGGRPDLLDRGEQEPDEDGDDGNDDQQFDQGERGTGSRNELHHRDLPYAGPRLPRGFHPVRQGAAARRFYLKDSIYHQMGRGSGFPGSRPVGLLG
jgi:hypothetical protein